MSGEFGYVSGGYIDHALHDCAERMCTEGDLEITRLYGDLVLVIADVAETLALAEADDVGEGAAILRAMNEQARLADKVEIIVAYLGLFSDVMSEAAYQEAKRIKGDENGQKGEA